MSKAAIQHICYDTCKQSQSRFADDGRSQSTVSQPFICVHRRSSNHAVYAPAYRPPLFLPTPSRSGPIYTVDVFWRLTAADMLLGDAKATIENLLTEIKNHYKSHGEKM